MTPAPAKNLLWSLHKFDLNLRRRSYLGKSITLKDWMIATPKAELSIKQLPLLCKRSFANYWKPNQCCRLYKTFQLKLDLRFLEDEARGKKWETRSSQLALVTKRNKCHLPPPSKFQLRATNLSITFEYIEYTFLWPHISKTNTREWECKLF